MQRTKTSVHRIEATIDQLLAKGAQIQTHLERERKRASQQQQQLQEQHEQACGIRNNVSSKSSQPAVSISSPSRVTVEKSVKKTPVRAAATPVPSNRREPSSKSASKGRQGRKTASLVSTATSAQSIAVSLPESYTTCTDPTLFSEKHSRKTPSKRLGASKSLYTKDSTRACLEMSKEPKNRVIELKDYGVVDIEDYTDFPCMVESNGVAIQRNAKVYVGRHADNKWVHVHYILRDEAGKVLVDVHTDLYGNNTTNTFVNGQRM